MGNMVFNVEIRLYTTEEGKGCRTFYKKIGADSKDQACDFAKQLLNGFLKNNIKVCTKVVDDESIVSAK